MQNIQVTEELWLSEQYTSYTIPIRHKGNIKSTLKGTVCLCFLKEKIPIDLNKPHGKSCLALCTAFPTLVLACTY